MGVRRFSCIETLKVHHMVGAFGHSKIFEVYPYIYISTIQYQHISKHSLDLDLPQDRNFKYRE